MEFLIQLPAITNSCHAVGGSIRHFSILSIDFMQRFMGEKVSGCLVSLDRHLARDTVTNDRDSQLIWRLGTQSHTQTQFTHKLETSETSSNTQIHTPTKNTLGKRGREGEREEEREREG